MSAAEATRARVCPSSTPMSYPPGAHDFFPSHPPVQVMARKAADAEAKLKKEEAAAAAEMAEAAKTKFTKSKRKSTTPRRSFAEASAVAASTHAGKSAPVEADDTLAQIMAARLHEFRVGHRGTAALGPGLRRRVVGICDVRGARRSVTVSDATHR